MDVQKVSVLGCGLMGSGITQVVAQAGYNVVVREVNDELLEKGLKSIEKNVNRMVEKGTLTETEKKGILGRIKGTTRLDDVRDSDLVIEAIIENVQAKREIFQALDQLCPRETILASNTSSISITEISSATKRPERVIGLHFFNPVPVMKLVEVIRTLLTDDAVFEAAVQFAERLGKTPVRTSDRTGFIVNRLLVPYLLDAVRALEEGVASIVDLDNAMKLGCGHPMGPLTLLDFVGLDTTYYISEVMFNEFHEARFASPPLLRRLVLAGYHGRKTGKGFYDYSDPKNPRPFDFFKR